MSSLKDYVVRFQMTCFMSVDHDRGVQFLHTTTKDKIIIRSSNLLFYITIHIELCICQEDDEGEDKHVQ